MMEQLKKKKGKTDEVVFAVDDELNSKVSLWSGNITTLEIDCIVNAANSSLLAGFGGVPFHVFLTYSFALAFKNSFFFAFYSAKL